MTSMYAAEQMMNDASESTEAERVEAVADEIRADEPSASDTDAVCGLLSRFTYTTTLLAALAAVVGEEDADGAALVLEFAGRFAEHEAKSV